MEIAAVLNVHNPSDIIKDTIDSISVYMTDKILLVIDGIAWNSFKSLKLPVYKVKGYRHGVPKSPYRNIALGLMSAYEKWPQTKWYVYCEYDVLFGSSRFKENLRFADEKDVWMLGNDGRVDEKNIPLVNAMLGEELKNSYYLLGCCQFFSKNFMDKLKELDFFDRFLDLTNNFSPGVFPHYSGYDISENLYPTLARHFGGNVGVFSTWDGEKWHGAGEYYPIRWLPELEEDVEKYSKASILHPIKSFDHKVRKFYRDKRK